LQITRSTVRAIGQSWTSFLKSTENYDLFVLIKTGSQYELCFERTPKNGIRYWTGV